MIKTKMTNSASKKERGCFDFKIPCGDFEKMTWMMKKFCRDEESGFDCMAIMRGMCGGALKESNNN